MELVRQVMAEHDDVLDETGDCPLCSLCAWASRANEVMREIKGFIQLIKEHTPTEALSALDTIKDELAPLLKEDS